MQFIPAIDVLDGRVVRLMRGSYDDVTVYADDAVAVARDHVARGAETLDRDTLHQQSGLEVSVSAAKEIVASGGRPGRRQPSDPRQQP